MGSGEWIRGRPGVVEEEEKVKVLLELKMEMEGAE